MNMNKKKSTMLNTWGSESIRELTSLLMLGTALILRRGLMTLRVLRDFRLGILGIIEIQLIKTTVRSKIFQISLM